MKTMIAVLALLLSQSAFAVTIMCGEDLMINLSSDGTRATITQDAIPQVTLQHHEFSDSKSDRTYASENKKIRLHLPIGILNYKSGQTVSGVYYTETLVNHECRVD